MFNGIIYKQGLIKEVKFLKESLIIGIKSNIIFRQSEIGSSVCCNGVCLTLTKIKKKIIFFYLSKETLKRSNFKNLKINDKVNIEKSLRYGDKISGHFTQGHIDSTGVINGILVKDSTWFVKVKIAHIFRKYLIDKGSICLNGVSLTISNIFKDGFEVTIIPHTLKLTNLGSLKKNDLINIEYDILSKYVLNI